jgi:hypothetical protein
MRNRRILLFACRIHEWSRRGLLAMNDDYESKITLLFCELMTIVRERRKNMYREQRLQNGIKRFNIDPRIMSVLDNEYWRSLEEPGYRMRPIAWIIEDIRRVDAGGEIQFWNGGVEPNEPGS